MRLAPLAFAFLFVLPSAQAAEPLSLAQIMADPDWIGPSVEDAWWRWDGKAVDYTLKREGASIRDTWQQPLEPAPAEAGGTAAKVGDADRAKLDASDVAYDAGGSRMAFVRNGDVFVRDLRSGALTQLTRSNDGESRLQWGSDGALVWRGDDNAWFRWNGNVVAQAAQLEAADAPGTAPADDSLRDRQLRLMRTLADDKAQRDAAREQDETWRRADPSRAPAPLYLGKDVDIVDSSLSPDGRWLLAVTTEKGADAGKAGQLQKFVTESGYEEQEEERTRVGRNDPLPQKLWLVDVASGKVSELKFDPLPGIAADPLAALRKAAGKDALKGNRPLQVTTSGDNGDAPSIRWSGDSRNVAVMLRAIDNKDRWIASVDFADAKLQPRHRLHDDAWINWEFNEFGWLPDGRTLWYLSEESGFSHLYTLAGSSRTQLTDGKWETSQVAVSRDGKGFYFLCNRDRPIDYEVCNVPATGGAVREVTSYDGVENFVQSPDGSKLLVRHSSAYLPPQLAVVDAGGGNARELTDTRSAAFKAIDWIQPESVQVPSKHGAGAIWGKYYGPANPEPGRKYPIVMFVHGAGYLQNAELRWPDYFREQMFHNLLVQQGFVVLDLDYRASEGYGRDWRTAIYRWMGKPELEDYLDGLDWAVANRQADRDRAGIYGGSYGGFMTFVALFKAPGVFKAGAALRPVSDWTQYNHEYTSNILNTPDLDPEAYKRSSPIEYADGLRDRLLIAHGMIDDNVLFKDSVDMTQKLIELRKDNWSIAPYPMERHGFVHPDAWYDEYRRIDELFLDTLKP
ncbi:S9 family peptidase [Pseudoluteimonas lycopersici]|uniref:S9 family peptidase n=1 Tax=Pseudoluteimonas lycopersici TaxID=1324796 RepID=A0A516V6T0_9GAMM|nr:S9 family peptidase [Lysobacter lycopersici]QDQ74213.1 S9 family peptidase [Lysobacter lycopersici]